MKKGILKKIALVLLPLLALGILALFDPNVADIGEVAKQITPGWFLLALGSILLYYLLDALMYFVACRMIGEPQNLGESVLTTMVGFFYSALTPFASGGQPMQVLQMRRRGMRVGSATSVLLLKFLGWQIAITVLGVLGFAFLSESVLSSHVSVLVMYVIGFLIFSGSVALAFMAISRPQMLRRLGDSILNLVERRKIIKKQNRLARARSAWQRTISDYGDAAGYITHNKGGMCLIFLIAALEAFFYMAVTYFIYRGLGFAGYSIAHIVLLQGLLYLAVSFFPLPGASVASEGGFYLVFSEIFTPAARFPAVLLWRVLTYYSALVLGMVAVAIDGVRNPKVMQEIPEEIALPDRARMGSQACMQQALTLANEGKLHPHGQSAVLRFGTKRRFTARVKGDTQRRIGDGNGAT